MIPKITSILLFSLAALFLGLLLYPLYIKLLQKLKFGKTIREDSVTWDKASIFRSLHGHKAGIPTMWWWLILIIVLMMIIISVIFKKLWYSTHSLIAREETYMLIFWFFSMWFIWLVDDILNIKGYGRKKGLNATTKTIWMFIIASFISYWFYVKLWVDSLYIRPINLIFDISPDLDIWYLFPVFAFLLIYWIVNAINITDWLDGLAWWMMSIILTTLVIPAIISQIYVTTTIVMIVVAALLSFMRYNISPAKVFMWDSGSFALWWLLATLILILNMRWMSIIIPFMILFWIFILEFMSSFLQIFWKKVLKRKLFTIAPFHHLLEAKGMPEATIVLKFWFIQAILATITIIMLFYQIYWTL